MEMIISFPGGKKVNVNFNNFIIKTDQPIENGGNNANPDPFSLFISSIGACTGFYILSFCLERNIPIEDIELILKTNKNKNNMVEKIDIGIITNKSFPDKYIKSIIKVANLCTVKKHLESPPTINISLIKK
jgi:ribosomal protein S12 methylthiotransferase accessory factor